MKRTLLLVTALLLSGLAVHAQTAITVNSSDIVGAGYTILIAEDTVNTYTKGTAGANKTWIYTGLAQHKISTSTFTSPAGLAGASAFPTANLAFTSDDPDKDSSSFFLLKTSAVLTFLGIANIENNGDTITTSFILDFLTFPSNMGTSFNSSYTGLAYKDTLNIDPDNTGPHPTIDSIKIIRSTSMISEIDAWGTLTTPLGSFEVLRQNTNETIVDSLFMKTNGTWKEISPEFAAFPNVDSVSTYITYSIDWWSNDPAVGFPLVSFNYDNGTGDNIGPVEWLKANPTIGIYENIANNELVVYPNPSSGEFTIQYKPENSSATVSVYDNLGRLVIQESLKGHTGLNLSDATGGIYLVRIEDGDRVLTKKILVK